jgi:hypothetical protein
VRDPPRHHLRDPEAQAPPAPPKPSFNFERREKPALAPFGQSPQPARHEPQFFPPRPNPGGSYAQPGGSYAPPVSAHQQEYPVARGQPPRGTPSTYGGASAVPKMPDPPRFSGEDKDEDYERWRMLAVGKCETMDDLFRINYLQNFIKGEAWTIVKNIAATSYQDLLEELDKYYGDTSEEKLSAAIKEISDGSLKQKNGETFRAWKARFMAVRNTLCSNPEHAYPDSLMLSYARQYMRAGLAAATSRGSVPREQLFGFLKRAQIQDRYDSEIGAGRATDKAAPQRAATTTATAPAARAATRTVTRYTERKATKGRTLS